MNGNRLKYLLEQYRLRQCSQAEMDELNEWFHTYNPGRTDMNKWLQEAGGQEKLTAELYADFTQRIKAPARVTRITWPYKVAAASVILAALLILLYPGKKQGAGDHANVLKPNQQQTTAGIKPGGNKAVLKLADGSEIELTDSANAAIATQNNTEIKQTGHGSIAYQATGGQPADVAVVYNTLTTPRGGKYTLTLSDGTVVTLDAASSITYPVAFTGKERRVQITGQAYFEVVHNDAQPFRVSAKGQLIEDIGTAFNVNAYSDDPSIRITLAEGKVDIHNASSTVSLLPGQQAMVKDGQEKIQVKYVNVEETVAWKNGWFVFHHETVQNVMKLAARWYDVEVVYEGAPIVNQFGGNISRYKDISELLQNLKIISGINYRIEGRKVILMN